LLLPPQSQSFHGDLTIRYPAYLEIDAAGKTRAYVFRLPGLFVDASGPEQAVAGLPDAVRQENEWLERSGVALSHAPGDVEIDEVERIRISTDVSRGEWKGLFRYELRPTTPSNVETTLERTALARANLLGVLTELGPVGLARLDSRLERFCNHELFLLSRLGSRLETDLPAEALERLRVTRELSENRLRNLLPGDKERLAVFEGEKWTTRKVLRCFAVAERVLLREVVTGTSHRSPGAERTGRSKGQSPR
jgi:hypothetical protein